MDASAASRGPATRYAGLGDAGLLSLFSTDQWGKLSFAEKIDACQEVENRYAAAHGCEPCTVRAEPMTGATFGYQDGRSICLNESVVRDGTFLTEDVDENGATVLVPMDVRASNWQTLETVFHEGTHGLQESRGQVPGVYFDPESDYDIYRIQPIEKEAFEAGQENTLRAIAVVQGETGRLDPSAADYVEAVKAASYQASLEAAARNYGDEDIDVTVATVIQHRAYGLTMQNPTESYKALSKMLDEQEQRVDATEGEQPQGRHPGQGPHQGGKDGQAVLGAQVGRDAHVLGGQPQLGPQGQGDGLEGEGCRPLSQAEPGAETDDGLASALGGRDEGRSLGAGLGEGASASEGKGADGAREGAAQGLDDGLGSTSSGMDDSPASDNDGGGSAGASNDNDDSGGAQDNDGSGGSGSGGSDRGGGQDM